MLPTHFLAFRGLLEPASGFQSEQFREIEFLCGLKDEKMLRYHRPTPEAYASLQRRLEEPFAARCILRSTGSDGANFRRQRRRERKGAILKRRPGGPLLYRMKNHHRDWIDVCERLTEFDELVVSWRLRHIQLVERIIGIRTGTGGSAGIVLPEAHSR